MIITLTGNNSHGLQRRLRRLVQDFVKDYGELAVERIDASEAEIAVVKDAVQSLPFLSESKLIILREPSKNNALSEHIEQIISSVPESVTLIIYEPAPDKRTTYFKYLQKNTEFEQLDELDSRELSKWLSQEAKTLKAELSPADADYLIERVGTDQQLLSNELDKLALYDKNITRPSIDILTEPAAQSRVFDLLDAAFSSDKQKAMRLYDEQRSQKIEPQAIMAMLVWQLHLITLAKLSDGMELSKVAADTGLKTYPLGKAAALAGKTTISSLRQVVDELLEIDVKSKTSSLELDEALKNYIVSL